jgi:hypothetical protein
MRIGVGEAVGGKSDAVLVGGSVPSRVGMSEGEVVAIGAGVVQAAARITRRKMIFFIRTILAQLKMCIMPGVVGMAG